MPFFGAGSHVVKSVNHEQKQAQTQRFGPTALNHEGHGHQPPVQTFADISGVTHEAVRAGSDDAPVGEI